MPNHGGQTVKQAIKMADRNFAISKYNYILSLIGKKEKQHELLEWSQENLSVDGVVTSLEGLYGVAMVKIL